MQKRIGTLLGAALVVAACATTNVQPPAFHVEGLPLDTVSQLSLEERIIVEEAWGRIRQGEARRAEKLIGRLGPRNPFYGVGLAYVRLLTNELAAAEELFKKEILANPDLSLAHAGLAQLYVKLGKDDAAFNEYQEVLKRQPDNAWAKQEFENLRTRKTDEHLREARAAFEAGNLELSKAAFLKTLNYSPKDLEAHLSLARLYSRDKQYSNALLHWGAIYQSEPKNKELLKEYAGTLLLAEQFGRALDIYTQLLDLDPKNKEIKDRVENLKNRLRIFELPSQYDAIPASQAVTREEVAALVAAKFKDYLDEPVDKPPVIIDVATSWASKFIYRVTGLGLMSVYANHTFQPKQSVTRAEVAEVLVRLVNLLRAKGFKFINQIPPEMIRIVDVSPDNFYYQTIADVLSLQLMELGPDRAFRPEMGLSGQEALRIFDLVLNLIK